MEQKVDEQFLCIICLQIAKGAFETSCCHQICCQICKSQLQKVIAVCPACRTPCVKFMISHCLRRIIENLTGIKSEPEESLPKVEKPVGGSNLTLNKDGVPIFSSLDNIHLQKILIYCGRNVGQSGYNNPCGECDGRCGPIRGCQCLACFELQSKFTIETNKKGNKVHISFDKYHNKRIKYYCGMKRDTECQGCDDRCGPTNGCQCTDCAELLE